VSGLWVGLDRGDVDLPHLEHDLLAALAPLGPAPTVCTLLVHDGLPHHAASASLPDAPGAVDLAAELGRALAAFGGALVALGGPGEPALELGDEACRDGARRAARGLRDGREGRAVRFPGQAALTGRLPVGEVVARSAVAELVPIGTALTADRILDTRDHVRPLLSDGALRLAVVPAAGGVVVPHERLGRHACCGGH